MLLSNVYLHYALDLWFEHVVKVRLRDEAHLVRYIDDFVSSTDRMPSAWKRPASPVGEIR